jgi:hypothetical protein
MDHFREGERGCDGSRSRAVIRKAPDYAEVEQETKWQASAGMDLTLSPISLFHRDNIFIRTNHI